MKKITIKLLAAVAVLFTTAAAALAQGSFAYQAVIRSTDGSVVSNQKVGMRFTLLSEGKEYYSEVQTPTTNEYGNVSVMIGSGSDAKGNFVTDVPWSSMNIMLKIEVDVKGGTDYIELGQTQLLSVPYAMYAQSAGKIEASQKTASVDDPIFEVKDKDGNLVFAVFPDGVKVYVDDTDASKAARRSGFVVTGRSATKDGAAADYFAVNAEGTQVYVDDADSKAARRSGFVVTGRSATKDGEAADYLAVNGEGTQVYVDDADSKAARRSGFVVTGRSATKDANAEVFKIDGEGTQVFINDTDSKAARRSGFVVTGRSATKDGQADYLAVGNEGTQVYVDLDADKAARRSGFVVTGRSATKDADVDVFVVDGEGTQVIIDDTDGKAARRSGFVVTGRSATKDSTANQYLSVTGESIDFSSSSFNVADKNSSEKVLAVTNGNVQVNSDLLMTGEVGKVVDAEPLNDDVYEIKLTDTVVTTLVAQIDDGELSGGSQDGRYILLRTNDNTYVPVYDSLMFDVNGFVATKKNAVVSVSLLENWDEDDEGNWVANYVINVRVLTEKLTGFSAEFGLAWSGWDSHMQQESYLFKKVRIVSDKITPKPTSQYYGEEKGYIKYNITTQSDEGETKQTMNYYFTDYGNKEYFLMESEAGKSISYMDIESSINKTYIYANDMWVQDQTSRLKDKPMCLSESNEGYSFEEATVNGIKIQKYEDDLWVHNNIIMKLVDAEGSMIFESADFDTDVQDFYEWSKEFKLPE